MAAAGHEVLGEAGFLETVQLAREETLKAAAEKRHQAGRIGIDRAGPDG